MATIEQILASREQWLNAVASGRPAPALVEATFQGCREAVSQLGSHLIELDYPWRTFLLPCALDLDERLARIENHTAVRVPSVIREFWRIVGGIALVDLKQYSHVAFWDSLEIQGACTFCDGVYVDACDDDWVAYVIDDFDTYAEDDDEKSFLYSLAPDGYHKDDISGGPPYSVGRRSDWAPTWEDFDWTGYRAPETAITHPPDFVSYLRTAILECAGFPGFFGHEAFEPIRQDLVRDLRPF